MKDNETFEFENRTYINPDISRDEQTAFIDTLRDIQAQNNAQIKTETHNLGTDVEPIRGGLTGSEEYWNNRYQTPQTNAVVANMKTVAQQTALNNALSNYQNMLQEKYNQAYRDYQKRAYNYSRKSSGGTGGTGGGSTDPTDDITYNEGGSKTADTSSFKLEGLQKNQIQNKAKELVKEGYSYIDAWNKAKEMYLNGELIQSKGSSDSTAGNDNKEPYKVLHVGNISKAILDNDDAYNALYAGGSWLKDNLPDWAYNPLSDLGKKFIENF